MRLDRIKIENFRSIKDATIHFKHNCIILVGLNESGKSNILKALSLLDPDIKVKKEDCREKAKTEDEITEAYVNFIFKLDETEKNALVESVCEKIYGLTPEVKLIKDGSKVLNLKEFIVTRAMEALYWIDIIKCCKYSATWKAKSTYVLCDKILKLTPEANNRVIEDIKGNEIKLSGKQFVDLRAFPSIPDGCYQEATYDELDNIICSLLNELVTKNLPQCIFWEYSDSNLLPGKIQIDTFKNDPDTCTPLKNLFHLAGVADITGAITKAGQKNQGLWNLVEDISLKATSYIRNIWKEKKDIEISLVPDGTSIKIAIKDTYNRYDFAARSDGFKRFVSFLLMISAEERNGKLSDALILIDEPEIGLHPSGAKSLRDELLKISKNNIVVYSTHSIHMIDSKTIDRHIIIKKEKEKTILDDDLKSSLVDEEILYDALGASVFEILKQKNILFEGWRDKEFFKLACKKFKYDTKRLGFCHANGVKDLDSKAGLIELAGKDFIIFSDADKIALEHKSKSSYASKWKTYSDFLNETIITYEDLIDKQYIEKTFTEILKPYGKDEFFVFETSESVIQQVTRYLHKSINQNEIKSIINQFKEVLINDLKPKSINDDYKKVIDGIVKVLDDTSL